MPETRVETLRFASVDGTQIEGEQALADDAVAAAALCHPHPQYGGSMRAGIIGDLFAALPRHGVSVLRFNFRGVERSDGAWDEGRAERGDAAAAVTTLAAAVPETLPLVLVGWSFGADMALSVTDSRVDGWCLIAPPMHFAGALAAVGADARPKHLILGAHDDVVSGDRIGEITTNWQTTTVEVIPDASHFFLGASAAVTAAVFKFCTDSCR